MATKGFNVELAYSKDLPDAIGSLIKLKSQRDSISFTPSKLAKAIRVDRSLIQRILSGEVSNPRIDTLMKIAKFFIEDGFSLTLDDLIRWKTNVVDVQNQTILKEEARVLPLYQMGSFNGERIGTTTIIAPKPSPGTIAVISDKHIEPIFCAGSLFIVDMMKSPQHEHLVMIRIENSNELVLGKYLKEDSGYSIVNSSDSNKNIKITSDINSKVIGVVIRVNIKT